MDTNSTTVFALRVSRRAAKTIALVGVVGCLAVTGFAAAVTGAGAALRTQQHDIVSVDRTHKAIGYRWRPDIPQLSRRPS